jgi:hypothetical protein
MPQVVIVTPALRSDNNGNWQTAQRWQRIWPGIRSEEQARHADRGDAA